MGDLFELLVSGEVLESFSCLGRPGTCVKDVGYDSHDQCDGC